MFSIAVLFGSKRIAALAILTGALYITQAQQIEIAGINLFAIRIIEICAVTRLILRGEIEIHEATKLDKAFLLTIIYTVIIYTSRSNTNVQAMIGTGLDLSISFCIQIPYR